LKFARKDGIQCKRCYYFIPSEEMMAIIGAEEKKVRDAEAVTAKEEKKTARCPKCRTYIDYTKLTDGGIMCKKCYNWIAVEGEPPAEPVREPGDMIPYSPPVVAYTPPERPKPAFVVEIEKKKDFEPEAPEITEPLQPALKQQEPEPEEPPAGTDQINEDSETESTEPAESIEETDHTDLIEQSIPAEEDEPEAPEAEEESDHGAAPDDNTPRTDGVSANDLSELLPAVEKKKVNLFSVDEALLDEIMNPQSGESRTVMDLVPEIEIEFIEEDQSDLPTEQDYEEIAEEDSESSVYEDEAEPEPLQEAAGFESDIKTEPEKDADIIQPAETQASEIIITPETEDKKADNPVSIDENKVIEKLAMPEFKTAPKPLGSGDIKKIQSVFSSRTFDIRKITRKIPPVT
jgi:hypothetical protein